MEFFVYSRPVFESVGGGHDVPHVVVSINCPGEEPAKFESNELTLGRVNLFFWDLDAVPAEGMASTVPEEHLCQPEDAQKIVDLLDAHPEAERVIVHCTAGKSRSAAVAAALMKSIEGDDSPIFNNPRYKPNMRVYRMVLNAWHDRHSGE
jgi:predicted protein tyrosine phosphatase